MTKFAKENFEVSGEYIHYEGKFIARFKYQRGAIRPYITFLINNFEVEEFFAMQDAYEAAFRTHGTPHAAGIKSPFETACDRGFIMPHIKKWLRDGGYEVSNAGYKKFREDQIRATLARIDAAAA